MIMRLTRKNDYDVGGNDNNDEDLQHHEIKSYG